MALMTENGKKIASQKVDTMTATKPNIEELKALETMLPKEKIESTEPNKDKVLVKLMMKAPADDLADTISGILTTYGSDELVVTFMLEKA